MPAAPSSVCNPSACATAPPFIWPLAGSFDPDT